MEGVTDTVFRQIVTSVGKPDVFYTEFVPVEALLSKGKEKALSFLKYTEFERPIVAQIWGTNPEHFYQVAKLVKKLGFDGIDINMGCPVRNVTKIGACSALIKNPVLAVEIINATIKGAGGLPVSVKTRIGFDKIITEQWVTTLLQTKIAALTLHLRTSKELSTPPAHWDEMEKAVKIRDQINSEALLIGNGGVKTITEARKKCAQYGIDGVMIGTGIFENVWLFDESVDITKVTPGQKIDLLIKHLELYKKIRGFEHFQTLKKFVKCYVNNFAGASEIREKLMATKTLDELIKETKKLAKSESIDLGAGSLEFQLQ